MILINTEYYRKRFEKHVATYTDYGNIKIIDFANPASSEYRIRFLFEDDQYRLHISGDLGELIAKNAYNMTFQSFYQDFANNPGYFCEKVQCCSRPLYYYDESSAKEEVTKMLNDYCDFTLSQRSEYIDEIFAYFSETEGFSGSGSLALTEALDDKDLYCCEQIKKLSKRMTDIIPLYLFAFTLAYKQLQLD